MITFFDSEHVVRKNVFVNSVITSQNMVVNIRPNYGII